MRVLLDIMVPIAVLYGCVVGLVFLFQSHLVYYPAIGREVMTTPQAYGLVYEDIEITTEDGEKIAGWWVPAAQARGTVLMFHGNAGNISHRLDYLRMFHALGYATLIIDYRGYGRSTGSPSEAGTYRDAVAAWRHLTQQRGIAGSDIVLFGESLGAAVASWLATRHTPRALVLASPFTSVPDLGAQVYWFLPVRLISRFRYDNLANLTEIKAPVLIAHSREDEIVPFAHGERLYQAAREPKQFLTLRGGHNDGFIFARDEWVRALADFLERHVPEQRFAQ
ncbi:MAG TPA: alpha/beta hydrolase [Burkholderiales bacterium]|nr:alpha/beta hydrolase [Burkholderiales bacterium]